MSVDGDAINGAYASAAPSPLFRTDAEASAFSDDYDVTADGRRFLVGAYRGK